VSIKIVCQNFEITRSLVGSNKDKIIMKNNNLSLFVVIKNFIEISLCLFIHFIATNTKWQSYNQSQSDRLHIIKLMIIRENTLIEICNL